MFYDESTFISIDPLASHLGLPKSFLKELADKKMIPSLDVNGRRRFNPVKVQEVLDDMAASEQISKGSNMMMINLFQP